MPRRLQPKSSSSTGRNARKNSDELRQIWKPSSTHPNIWFHSINGHTFELKECCLLDLTDEEIRALQKVALCKLQNMNLGASVTLPKDESCDGYKNKEGGLLVKVRRSHTTNITQLLDILKDREKDGEKQEENGTGVFGIPLGKCVANDEERLRRRSQQSVRSDSSAASATAPSAPGHGSTSMLGVPASLTQSTSHQNLVALPNEQDDCSGSLTRSLPGSDSSSEEEEDSSEEQEPEECSATRLGLGQGQGQRQGQGQGPASQRTPAASVKRSASSASTSSSASASASAASAASAAQRAGEMARKASSASSASASASNSTAHLRRFLIDDPQALAAQVNKPGLTVSAFVVPHIVQACCSYLQHNGLNAVGLFRIGSSKKRLKELKDEYDSGKDIVFDDSCNPHDAATLLKEFFRDLPEPLLTRDLYNAFLAAYKKLSGTAGYHGVLQYLISLLPRLNRNTLWKLLALLDAVAKSSTDTVDQQGRSVVGNKMDAHNLASMLGPNILHKSKPGSSSEWSSAPSSEQKQEQILEEQTTVANVVQDLIVSYRELFTVSASLYDEMLRTMNEVQPEDVHFILSCRLRGAWPPPLPPVSPTSITQQEAEAANCSASTVNSAAFVCRKVSLGAECSASVPPKRQQSFSGQAARRNNALSMFALGDAHRAMTAMAQGFLENLKDDTSEAASPAADQPTIRITNDAEERTHAATPHESAARPIYVPASPVRRTQTESGNLSAVARSSDKAPSPSLQRYCRR